MLPWACASVRCGHNWSRQCDYLEKDIMLLGAAAGSVENNAYWMQRALVESGFWYDAAGAKNAYWMRMALVESGFWWRCWSVEQCMWNAKNRCTCRKWLLIGRQWRWLRRIGRMCDSFVFRGKTIRIVRSNSDCSMKCFGRRGREVKDCAVLVMEAGNYRWFGDVRRWNVDASDCRRYAYVPIAGNALNPLEMMD